MRISFVQVCWWIFLLVWLVSAFSVKPVKERQSLRARLSTLAILAIAFTLLSGDFHSPSLNARILPQTAAVPVVGNIVMLLGLMTAIWARFVLGGNWSGTVTFKEDHELIERGPYRFVRHPIYTGLLLMILGTAIVMGRASGFLGLVICFFGTWHKLKQEETLLTKHFPETYPKYMARTKALLPFLL